MPLVTSPQLERMAAQAQQRAIEVRQQRQRVTQEAVQEIQDLRREIETLSSKLQERSDALRTRARRTLDEDASNYVVFANAHLRFSGAILQGLRRTSAFDRVLRVSQAEREEARRREEWEEQQRQVREHGQLVNQLQLPSEDAMSELYGEIIEEEMTHA